MADPRTIDAHTHIISPDRARYPLQSVGLEQGTGKDRRPADWFEAHAVSVDRLMEGLPAAGVDGVILVQAMGAYGYDNSYCADAAVAHPARTTSVCIVDPLSEDAVSRLRYWVRDRGMCGVRLFAIGSGGSWLDGASGVALFRAAGSLGVPVVVTILSNEVPRLDRVLREFPDVPVALDHCGFPNLAAGPPYVAARSLFELASHRNLRLKVSGLLLAQIESAGGRPADFVTQLASTFGARRLLWGSDYPQTHDRSYAELVALCRGAAADLSEDDRRWYLGGTAMELWPELASGR